MIRSWITGSGLIAALLLAAPPARAQEATDPQVARDDEIAELKRQLDVVLDELDRLKTSLAVPEQPELESRYGMGPAASRVYGSGKGISIGIRRRE